MQRFIRRDLLREVTRKLEAAGIEGARRNAEWICCAEFGCGRARLIASGEEEVSSAARDRVRAMAARRAGREPLQYILGTLPFWDIELEVTPAVLIPRPETEWIVERLTQRESAPRRVLDVGTGSGCIALALKSAWPEAEVVGVDLSEEALAVARRNADRNGLQVQFEQTDVLDTKAALPLELDLLVSNPPYIPDAEAETLEPEVRDHEPHLALFSGDDPLRFYRVLAGRGNELLHPGGTLALEVHADYGADVARLLEEAGYEDVELERDLAGRERLVCARRSGG